jgi:hypothetical protein
MPWSRFAVWRSSSLGWLITALALAAGVPQFLCLPPWNDVTLHDLAARNILRGGVHYRDLFDTNLPGIDWTMAAIRSAFGWSFVTLRVFDLLIVAGSVAILAKLAGQRAAWFAAAVAMWYPFTSEFDHCQRDVWMLLPAAAATLTGARNRSTIAQGFLWGLAVWFKPHVLIPAAAVWFTCRHANRWCDLGGVMLGGLIAGVLGVAWLVQTGAWPHFVDVFTRWNPEYVQDGIWQTLPFKMQYAVTCFLPWGLVHLAAVPVAVCDVRRRSPLAALYLGWLVQAVLLQKPFDYVQVPVLLLGFAVLASRGWSVGFPFVIWFVMWGRPSFEEWPRCFHECGSPELRDRLGHFTDTPWGTNWAQLRDVENFLRTVDPPLGDRELTCWHDTTHPLYLSLGLEPSTRYMHFGTLFPLRRKVDEIRAEVIRSPQRYVVSDLLRMTRDPSKVQSGEGLPQWLPQRERERFPWNQPVVFRSGRYVVHRVTRPPRPDEIDITDWSEVRP